MNKYFGALLLMVMAMHAQGQQQVIELYKDVPGIKAEPSTEAVNNNNAWNTKVVYNVNNPTLTVFKPDTTLVNSTGTGIVVCPGGGFQALSINSEGNDVAEWLAKKGVTAFVLRYRLIHTNGTDPVKELGESGNSKPYQTERNKVVQLSIADGRAALAYVREHAAEYGLSADKIGIIGFSAGGTVAASAAYGYTPQNKPNFTAPIYAYMPPELQKAIPTDAPPMFLAAATNDGLAAHATDLYTKWTKAGKQAEIHIYAEGGHGFGMRKQNLETDNWIDRFGEWLNTVGFLKPVSNVKPSQQKRGEDWANFQKMVEERVHKDWAWIKRYEEDNQKLPPPAAGEQRVVFMGNSITEGWINTDPDFFKGKPYIDRGIGGQTTPQMLVRFREDVINLKPAVVIILAGINDIAENNGPSKLEDVFGNIVSMAELARLNKIKVVLSSVLPASDFPWKRGLEPGPKVEKLNAMIKTYADKNKIVYVDYHSVVVNDKKGMRDELATDGVHPNLKGYKIMEPLAEKGIAEALKRKQ